MFPTFSDVTDQEINAALALAVPYFDVDAWDTFYAEGLGCFVAHQVVLGRCDKPLVDANDVTSRVTEHLNIARSAAELAEQARDPFKRTVFGQRFRDLARRYVGRGFLAV